MKNNTKVRLHLSKQLFESLTKEIIKEAKANDGYTVAVKQPKTPKQSKSQAASPEVQKTDAEAMMGEMETNVNEIGSEGIAALIGLIPGITLTAALIKDITKYMKSNNLSGIDGFKKAYQVVGKSASAHMDKTVGGNQPGEKAGQVNPAKTFGPQEGKLNEFTGTETESSGAIAMLAAALGMGVPLATALIKDLMKKKTPEEKKQAVDAALTKKTGADTTNLKEYEHHYEVRNGECRRYNDEGEYEVVSMHHCR